MDRSDLYELWQRNKDRPAFVRSHREAIHDHTDTEAPIPDGSLYQVRQWLDSYKGTVTRQLNDDTDGTDPQDDAADGETTTTDDAVGGA
jgi:hypothetical protein